mmetsp:Transcript_64237/g.134997  ORF Transcript_64237/g.134997 Transcript_64237/m.134997 type:complete len:244 (+) Transcript_64237:216-947(+)
MGVVFGSDVGIGSEVNFDSVLDRCKPCQFDALLDHLQVMQNKGFRFGYVSVWRQAFLGGAADHHTVVYEYKASGRHLSLKLDWGRDGLNFCDDASDPSADGDIIHRKWCRHSPLELREQLLAVRGKTYILTTWNCQHFSKYMFDIASESSKALTELSQPPPTRLEDEEDKSFPVWPEQRRLGSHSTAISSAATTTTTTASSSSPSLPTTEADEQAEGIVEVRQAATPDSAAVPYHPAALVAAA